MSDIVISVENLWKQYRYGTISHATLRRDFQSWWARIRGKPDPNLPVDHVPVAKNGVRGAENVEGEDRFWALKDVSLEVRRGEILGIIGKNGAGKSTLLKIMSRVTTPTKGQIKIKGRIASLLEVGTGFHPELTGKENTFLNGAILGMTKAEVRKKFDEIVTFAEVEKFIDTPVKRYSSGMYVRLAFAVAAHLEPEILLVDEVLAVGDAAFQKKCLGKMGEVAKGGRTVLFVSHNMTAISSLCDRCIVLDAGNIFESAAPAEAINIYLSSLSPRVEGSTERHWQNPEIAPGNEKIRLRSVSIEAWGRDRSAPFNLQTPVGIQFEYWQLVPTAKTYYDLVLYAQDGTCILNSYYKAPDGISQGMGLYQVQVILPAPLLNSGSYRVRLQFLDEDFISLYEQPDLAVFTVHDTSERDVPWHNRFWGVIHPDLEWISKMIQ